MAKRHEHENIPFQENAQIMHPCYRWPREIIVFPDDSDDYIIQFENHTAQDVDYPLLETGEDLTEIIAEFEAKLAFTHPHLLLPPEDFYIKHKELLTFNPQTIPGSFF